MINTSSFLQKAIEQQLSEGDMVTLNVTGRSMCPFLSGRGNDSVVVSKHDPEELKPGIIILFRYHDKYVFHRIVKMIDGMFIVQGDGNCVEIEVIKEESILAIVRYVIRNRGERISPYLLNARLYWHLWYLLRPVRKYLLFIHNKLYR